MAKPKVFMVVATGQEPVEVEALKPREAVAAVVGEGVRWLEGRVADGNMYYADANGAKVWVGLPAKPGPKPKDRTRKDGTVKKAPKRLTKAQAKAKAKRMAATAAKAQGVKALKPGQMLCTACGAVSYGTDCRHGCDASPQQKAAVAVRESVKA